MEDDSLPLSRQERTATIVFGTILAGFGLFWAIAASFVPTRNTYQAITPSFLPFWTGVILCGAGLLVVFATWKRQAVPDDPIQPLFIWSEQVRVAAFLAVLLAYCLLIEIVHYFWLTLATMLVALVIAREPIGIWLGVKALATAGIMFVIFIVWFSVPLPGSRFF